MSLAVKMPKILALIPSRVHAASGDKLIKAGGSINAIEADGLES